MTKKRKRRGKSSLKTRQEHLSEIRRLAEENPKEYITKILKTDKIPEDADPEEYVEKLLKKNMLQFCGDVDVEEPETEEENSSEIDEKTRLLYHKLTIITFLVMFLAVAIIAIMHYF